MESQRDPLKPPIITTTVAAAAKEPAVPKLLSKECNDGDNDEDEGDNESWFELDLTFPKQTSTDSDLGCSKRRASTTSTSSDDSNSTTTSMFYRDHIRRMESPDVRLSTDKSPRSPISTLRRLMYGAQKRSDSLASEFAPTPSRSRSRPRGVRFFSVRFRIEDVSTFRRSNSSRSCSTSSRVSIPERRSVDDASPPSSARQFSRYFNFLKPMYFRVSEKEKLREEFGGGVPSAAGISSPVRRGWMWSPMRAAAAKEKEERRNGSRFVGTARRLGKSRSTSEVAGVGNSPMSRKDDSMKQSKDGIEGAIQHCKQSLNSTSGRTCSLSRCTSDTYGKSFQRL